MPSDFPGSTYEAVYWLVDSKRRTSPAETRGGSTEMPGRRYLIIFSPVSAMMKHTQRQSINTGIHRTILSGICRSTIYSVSSITGLAALEALLYGLFAMGALVREQQFPMVTRGDRRAIIPAKTFETFSIVFPNEPLTLKFGAFKADQEWNNWNDTRNVLSHRMIPGRAYLLYRRIGSGGSALVNRKWNRNSN